jgi:hypothetical protein
MPSPAFGAGVVTRMIKEIVRTPAITPPIMQTVQMSIRNIQASNAAFKHLPPMGIVPVKEEVKHAWTNKTEDGTKAD